MESMYGRQGGIKGIGKRVELSVLEIGRIQGNGGRVELRVFEEGFL